MCGRYVLKTDPRTVASELGVSVVHELNGVLGDLAAPVGEAREGLFSADFNVAPTRQIPAVAFVAGARHLAGFTWGLVPSWAKDPSIGSRMINARGETAAEKPSFRTALAKQRILVPADGWYEWEHGSKTPHFFSSGQLLTFAGLWEKWGPEPLYTCTILTTSASAQFADIHDRMPVVVPTDLRQKWLTEGAELLPDLLNQDSGEITEWTVGKAVGSVRNNGPELIEPAQ